MPPAKHLLDLIYQNKEDLFTETKRLLETSAVDLNHITKYGESPLRVASNNGRFDVVKLLLESGADESQLEWRDINYVIAYGSLDDLKKLIQNGAAIEQRDFWSRTPFLFSILVGDIDKTVELISTGADTNVVGRCGKTPLMYAIQKDDVNMLKCLIDFGFDLEKMDEFDNTPLIDAAEIGSINCLDALIDYGANIFAKNHIPDEAIQVACNWEIVKSLVAAGADINDMDKEVRAELLGLEVDKSPECSQQDFLNGRKRIFGITNPEKVNNPFWNAMVKCGGNAYLAANSFHSNRNPFKDDPIWCYDRFGKSITLMPDGRIIEIAGEHEDSYDPDFCIYNDVFVHDGKDNFEIYSYPRDVFPPTDFHTATLVNDAIYIIGNLGYTEDRKPNHTPVYRLDVETLKIQQLRTSGTAPGWISRHKSFYDGSSKIVVSGGKLITDNNGEKDYINNSQSFSLCLETLNWQKHTNE